MEIMEVIRSRRSIRKFQDRKVADDVLRCLVEAGSLAPSASNLQAWKFILVTDEALVRKVDMFSPGLSGKPPVIMAICSDYAYADKRGGANAKIYGCIMDASMAAENIMLAAVEYGLGTCAIKSYNEAAVRKLLKLPEHIHMELLISIGYPEGEARLPARKPLSEILSYNEWREQDEE